MEWSGTTRDTRVVIFGAGATKDSGGPLKHADWVVVALVLLILDAHAAKDVIDIGICKTKTQEKKRLFNEVPAQH